MSGSLGPVELALDEYELLTTGRAVAGPGEPAAGCGHRGYLIESVCTACFEEGERVRHSAEVRMMLLKANPRIFARELIEMAKDEQLSVGEAEEARRRPAEALRAAGLGALLGS